MPSKQPSGTPDQTDVTTSYIFGTVTAPQRSPLPGGTVTAIDSETALLRTTVSEASGSYRLPSLPSGTYEVTASRDGFTPVTGPRRAARSRLAGVRRLHPGAVDRRPLKPSPSDAVVLTVVGGAAPEGAVLGVDQDGVDRA
jgi:hypothetical protein